MGVNVNLSNRQPAGNRSLSIIWIVAAGLGIIFGGLLIATVAPALLPTQGSAEAVQVDNLFRFMLAIGGSIFLLVVGILVYSVIAFRVKPGDRRDGPPIHGNATLELIWTIIPVIIVLILTVYAFNVWTSIRTLQPTHHDVMGVGQRFAWTFNYSITPETLPPGVTLEQLEPAVRDAVNSPSGLIFSSTQLHSWVDEQVQVKLTTQDVNHAFWIPGMRVKQDLLAGRETTITFTPILEGPYRIVCAELCGSGHGDMAGTVIQVGQNHELRGAWLIVHATEEDYLEQFYEPEAMRALFPPEDPVLRGRAILESGAYPCATCHTLDDLGWTGNIGPNLNNIGNNAARRISGTAPEDYLHNSLRHPADYLVPGFGPLMPQFNPNPGETNYMPESDLQAIVAYLLTQQQ